MRDTTATGDRTEFEIALALMRAGTKVLRPLSNGLRYDLVIDEDATFLRVQCKTGLLKDGAVQFRLYSLNASRRFRPRTYHGEIDAFGVYCPQTGRCYLVPISALAANNTIASLRIEPSRNRQRAGVRQAKDFEIG